MSEDNAASYMDDETKRIHLRLTAWAQWARNTPQSGWPQRTLLGRLVEDGLTGAAQPGPPPPIVASEEVDATNDAVRALGDIDKEVIETYYLRWEPVEVMAKRTGHSVSQFKQVLKRARWRVAGYLDGYWRRGQR